MNPDRKPRQAIVPMSLFRSRSLPYRLSPLLAALLLGCSGGEADWMDDTKQQAAELWQQTRALSGAEPSAQALPVSGGAPADIREPAPHFAEVWEQMLPRLNEALNLEDEKDHLPESAWLGRDRQDAQAEVDQLLDEAIGILGISDAETFRQDIQAIEGAIVERREMLVEFRQARITAPKDSLWKTTVEDYDDKIAALKEEIAELEDHLDERQKAFAAHLQELGLDLDEQQLEFLFSTVVGDDIIRMGIAFDNVRQLTVQLENLVVESQEDLETARRYYGMYTVLLRVLNQMYSTLILDIEQRYIPDIERIMEKAQDLAAETRELMEQYPERGSILRNNLSAQNLTLQASDLYREYLKEQREEVVDSRRRLNDDLRIAHNTYETVKVSGELVHLVQTSRNLLNTLRRMQIPTLRGFENLEMKREFERLTLQLKEASGD